LAGLAVACGLALAGCSAVGLGGADEANGAAEPIIDSEEVATVPAGAGLSDESGADDDPALANEAESSAESASETPFTRVEATALRPDADRSQFADVLAPTSDRGWLVVGSISDAQSDLRSAAVWEVADPATADWTRSAPLAQADEAAMLAAARLDQIDVVVGHVGSGIDRRPAVWAGSAPTDWAETEPVVLDEGATSTLYAVDASDERGQFVAAGWANVPGESPTGLVLVSGDGKTWSDISPDIGSGSPYEDVAIGPPGVVLADWVVAGEAGRRNLAVVLHSTDGIDWQEFELDPLVDEGSTTAEAVTWNGEKYTVVGSAAPAVGGPPIPVSWTSNDGIVWFGPHDDFERNDGDRLVASGFGADQVVVAGDRLLATATVGFVQQLWSSPDGRSWSSVGNVRDIRPDGVVVSGVAGTSDFSLLVTNEPSVLFNATGWEESLLDADIVPRPSVTPFVNAVVGFDDGFLAVGGQVERYRSGRRNTGRSWRSEDGSTWEETRTPSLFQRGPLGDVASVDGRVVAALAETTASSLERQRSASSRLWEVNRSDTFWSDRTPRQLAVDQNGRVAVESITTVGDTIVFGGWSIPFGVDDSRIYLAEAGADGEQQLIDIGYDERDGTIVASLCSDGDRVLAIVRHRDDRTAQHSLALRGVDGSWTVTEDVLVGDENEDDSTLRAVSCSIGPDGMVVVGWLGRSGGSVGLWHSPDGSVWSRATDGDNFATDANQWATEVVAVDGGYLVAGNDSTSGQMLPVLWFGTGDTWRQVVVDHDAVGMQRLQLAVNGDRVVVIGEAELRERVYTASLAEVIAAAEAG
jgi:hypothetical protein